jgi:uracil-DNA glycosylase
MNIDLAEALAASLPTNVPLMFNPYREHCEHDLECNGPEQRLRRLAQHLDVMPRYLMIGEAPGYQGCRYSGIAFTSERQLVSGEIKHVPCTESRLTSRHIPFSEPSATTVWRCLNENSLADQVVLWNSVQLHPYRPDKPLSNRAPNRAEMAHGERALHLLKEAFPGAAFVAIGGKAYDALKRMKMPVELAVRHPSFGGVPAFEKGIIELAALASTSR